MPDEPTLGELGRRLERIEQRLEQFYQDVIGRREYEADQEGIAQKFQQSADVHSEIKATTAALDIKIDAVDIKHTNENKEIIRKQDQYEKDQQSQRSQRGITVLGWVSSPILGAILGNVFRGSGSGG